MAASRWTSTDLPDLSGRTIVVTGASSGLGLETTRALAGAGAHVVLAVRDPGKGQRVAAYDAEHGALPIEYAATQDVPGGSYIGPDGFGHLRGYPAIHAVGKAARDAGMARRLWALSADLTGTPEPIRIRGGSSHANRE